MKSKKESTTTTTTTNARDARTHARDVLPPVIDVHTPPTLETLLAWAVERNYTDTTYVREWHDLWSNEYFWLDPKTGKSLRHWPAFFRACYVRAHADVTKPGLAVANVGGRKRGRKPALCSPRRRADNLLPSTDEQKEELRELFG